MATQAPASVANSSPPPRQQFVQRLDLIQQALEQVASRRRMPPDEREEFVSWALLRIVESDYSVVREWRGDAKFCSYLNVVVSRLLLDFRNHRWGKFRVCKAAQSAGSPAELLDRFIHRDGFSTDEAVEFVVRNHRSDLDREGLRDLASRLPTRQSRRTAPLEDSPLLPSVPPCAEEGLRRDERRVLCRELQQELDEALGELPCDDLRILILRFCAGRTADEIGDDLDLDRRRVYQRIETILARLRRHLCSQGFQTAALLDLVGADGVEMRLHRFTMPERDAA